MRIGTNFQILLYSFSFPYPLGSPPPHFLEFQLGSYRKMIFLSTLSSLSESRFSGCSSQNMDALGFYTYQHAYSFADGLFLEE